MFCWGHNWFTFLDKQTVLPIQTLFLLCLLGLVPQRSFWCLDEVWRNSPVAPLLILMLWPQKKELSDIILPETKYVAIKVEQARGAVRSLSTHARRSSNLPEVVSGSLAVSNFTHSSIPVISATWTVSEIVAQSLAKIGPVPFTKHWLGHCCRLQ